MAFSAQYTPKPITDIFTPKDTCVNRRELKRTVPMKVLILGLGRTGTSCKSVLEKMALVAPSPAACPPCEHQF